MKDQVFIFTGPTISPQSAQKHLDVSYLPPVKFGDVYRISELYQPRIIGIIDGYFNQVPAVWHKEIVWAINQGVTVYGASSMGALRAAELDQMGMIGVGKVFRAYQTGLLPPFNQEPFEDDDEVAVIHAPAELGYLAASDAMVNIRVTLAKAMQSKVIDQAMCMALCQIAKKLFYADRIYSTIVDQAVSQGLSESMLAEFKHWLKSNAVDQKWLDAVAMLTKIKKQSLSTPNPVLGDKPVFQHTAQWQSALEEIEKSHTVEHRALNELRLLGQQYFQTLDLALNNHFGIDVSKQVVDLNSLHTAPDQLHALLSKKWLNKGKQGLVDTASSVHCEQILLNYLHENNRIDALNARAQNKSSKIAMLESKPLLSDLGEIEKLQLCDWYFISQLNQDMPNNIQEYCWSLGIDDLDTFYGMILDEYLYQKE